MSEKGWDSDAVCYPCILEHDGHLYMLYNGNNYGITGFGYAVGNTNDLDLLYENCMLDQGL